MPQGNRHRETINLPVRHIGCTDNPGFLRLCFRVLILLIITSTAGLHGAAAQSMEQRVVIETSQIETSPHNSNALTVQEDVTVGLVLSGGGAKGIAHIGVLKVLEEAGVQVDVITGTSMGSIVGALYSIGYTPEEMAEISLTTNWEDLFTDRPSRRLLSMFEKESNDRFILSLPIRERSIDLPVGLVYGQNIMNWLKQHTWPVLDIEDFSDFPIPYATVATDLETGEAVVFNSGYLPDAIRASISFPTAFVPYRVNGRLLVDGGLIQNLPVQEAIDLGADYIIAVDVTTPLRTGEEIEAIHQILNQIANYRIIENVNRQKALADLAIDVTESHEYLITDFDMAREFLNAGETQAREFFEELQALARRQQQTRATARERIRPERETIQVERVSVTGNTDVASEVILSEPSMLVGRQVTEQEIEAVVQQLYSTRLFTLITYRIYREDDSYHVEFRVEENTEDSFRVGARYESETQASLLLHSSFRNPLHRGSNLRLNLRLGRDSEILTDYLVYGGGGSSLGINTSVGYHREQIDFVESGDRISSLIHHMGRVDLFAGTYLNPTYLLGLGMRRDFIRFSDLLNPAQIPFSERDHHAVYGKLIMETYNRRSYPTHGHQFLLQATFSDSFFGSPLTFNEQRIYWQAWHPLSSAFSLQHTLYLGRSYGEELPWSYWHSPNRRDPAVGIIRFGGFDRYELSGQHIQMISAGLQFEFLRHRFLRLDAYLGNTFESWDWNPSNNRYRTGFSLSAGALTVLGPIELILSGSARNSLLIELQVGYEF